MMFQKLTPECNDNDKNKLNDNYNEKSQYIQHIKNTLELLNEQNHLIITQQKSLQNSIDQQGQILTKAIDDVYADFDSSQSLDNE
ncbi:unnamed protein product [Rotaria magnacalcarata]|uniref:Uncharacterized protein n=1 Tax=Rotaria magnacalcarata TaxID=392030 RepID=A0A821DYS2_9BILA|nr:unnamed protein product [Rotaria magnacalcarata]CAF4627682.1 unnamed protein product [Rotaria magnacalcarata]